MSRAKRILAAALAVILGVIGATLSVAALACLSWLVEHAS